MISLTEKAKEKVLEIAKAEVIPPLVRAKISGGGCAGFSYDLHFEDEEKLSEMDEVFTHGEVRIVVDPMSLQYLEGSTIDYYDKMLGGGFKFENPNSTGSCGCGNSVSF